MKLKTALIIILTNLIIGNGILYVQGKSSYEGNVEYPIMIGISITCVVFYILFFRYSKFQTYRKIKLLFVSILNYIFIAFLGIFFTILITEPISITKPINEIVDKLSLVLYSAGFVGSLIMLPISLILGLLNFGMITYLKQR